MRQPVKGFRRSILAVTAALGFGALLSSCTSVPGLPGLGGSASMRIEVEVYKGPMSQEPDVQWGELRGLVRDTPRLLGLLDDALLAAAHSEGYLPKESNSEIMTATKFVGKHQNVASGLEKISLEIWELEGLLTKIENSLSANPTPAFDIVVAKTDVAKFDRLIKAIDRELPLVQKIHSELDTQWKSIKGSSAARTKLWSQWFTNGKAPDVDAAITAYKDEWTGLKAALDEAKKGQTNIRTNNLQKATPHCINKMCAKTIQDILAKITASKGYRQSVIDMANAMARKAEPIISSFDGEASKRSLNVKPRNRLVDPPDIAVGMVPVRGVAWGRYGAALRDDRAGLYCIPVMRQAAAVLFMRPDRVMSSDIP